MAVEGPKEIDHPGLCKPVEKGEERSLKDQWKNKGTQFDLGLREMSSVYCDLWEHNRLPVQRLLKHWVRDGMGWGWGGGLS